MRICKNNLVGNCQRLALWLLLAAGCWLLAAAPALAADDFDSEFRQLAGRIVSGDNDTEGSICWADGVGGETCVTWTELVALLVAAGYWQLDIPNDLLSPSNADWIVYVNRNGTCIVAESSSTSSATAAIDATGGDEDNPAIYAKNNTTELAIRVGGYIRMDGATSNPSAPQEGDLFYRTDLNEFRFYDGSAWVACGAGSGMASFDIAGDVGTPQTITNGNTLSALGGVGIDTTAGATDKWDFVLDTTEVGNTTWGTAAGVWTFEGGASDPTFNWNNGVFWLNAATTVQLSSSYLRIDGGTSNAGRIRSYEDSDNGGNYYEIGAAASLAGDTSWDFAYDATLSDGDVLTYHAAGATWDAPPGGGSGAYANQAEVDWGDNSSGELFKEFVITDASLTGSEYITASVAYEAPTGKDIDELEFDAFACSCSPAVGQFRLAMHSLLGPVHGNFKINYVIGTP